MHLLNIFSGSSSLFGKTTPAQLCKVLPPILKAEIPVVDVNTPFSYFSFKYLIKSKLQ